MANNDVTISVKGGPSATINWRQGLTALQAMEEASKVINPKNQFTFGLQYYESIRDYFVNMINETYDSFISHGGVQAAPFFYWYISVGDVPAQVGVRELILNPGDTLTFEFVIFNEQKHKNTILETKFNFQTQRV